MMEWFEANFFKVAFGFLAFYATLMLAFSGILPAPPEPERSE